MLTALAEQVVIDRLTRAEMLGNDSKGRVLAFLSEEGKTEAEKHWFGLVVEPQQREEE